jgi:hypothetical protein
MQIRHHNAYVLHTLFILDTQVAPTGVIKAKLLYEVMSRFAVVSDGGPHNREFGIFLVTRVG